MGLFNIFKKKSKAPNIEIAPNWKGILTLENLLNNEGSLVFVIDNHNYSSGQLWNISYESYLFTFSINFTEKILVLERNEELCVLPFNHFPIGAELGIIITWSHNQLALYIATKNIDPQIKDQNIVLTNSVFVPTEVLAWSRERRLLSVKTYESEEYLRNTVIACLESIQEKINKSSTSIFYDIEYSGLKIVQRKPKREIDVHPYINALLHDQSILLSLEIVPEYKSGVGDIDFVIIGRLENDKNCKICIECKNAHSPDLFHGIEVQLTKYLINTDSKYGIYLILNFEGEWFKNPEYITKGGRTKDTKIAVWSKITRSDNSMLRENIRIIELKLGKKPSASKKHIN